MRHTLMDTPPPVLAPVAPHPRLSEQLRVIADRCREEAVTVEELMKKVTGSPYLILMALLSLPFLTPIPMMGLSMPFGTLFIFFGLALMVGVPPTVSRKLLAMKLPSRFFPSLLRAASGFLRAIETFSRPRWEGFFSNKLLMRFYGLLIVTASILFMIPLPIPFTNFFPALALLLISLALIEHDGALMLAGMLAWVATVAYFGFIAWAGQEAIEAFMKGLQQMNL